VRCRQGQDLMVQGLGFLFKAEVRKEGGAVGEMLYQRAKRTAWYPSDRFQGLPSHMKSLSPWFIVYGLWFVVCGLWFVVCGLWLMVDGLWSQGLWLGFGVEWLVSGVCSTVSGVWGLISEEWGLGNTGASSSILFLFRP
jgi:hypothetical protein